jgi:hypothetical protein
MNIHCNDDTPLCTKKEASFTAHLFVRLRQSTLALILLECMIIGTH